MLINYSLTPSLIFLETIASGLSEACGKKVAITNNSLIFPDSLGEGRFEFIVLEPGLSICLVDCLFREPVIFHRNPLTINDFRVVHFNLSNNYITFNGNKSAQKTKQDQWKDSIKYSSSREPAEINYSNMARVQMVSIIFSNEWAMKRYDLTESRAGVLYSAFYSANLPDNFSLNMDLELLHIVRNMLFGKKPKYTAKLYYEGYAIKILAMVLNKHLSKDEKIERINFDHVNRIMAIKERIENRLDNQIPSLEQAARESFMNQSTFASLFKHVYKKNYFDFFTSAKMQHAAALLITGRPVSEVGKAVGYINLGHFSKAFRLYFNVNPKAYQLRGEQ
ncbi:AraC family transcriptional regulator [Danxiaibacter flavus]|uniref:AraC family transcriptional regulator n=1 Tax=Danxiaibacter flavus TaxID=3049108 RepID=A0ABV3ZJR4_9BACT|nr:AraC family transcriptional regulator [Chitinophagaceae bacterium DXS]